MAVPWKKFSNVLDESIAYIGKRKTGEIKSLKTKWKGFNSIGMDGLEWGSLTVVASRPGVKNKV